MSEPTNSGTRTAVAVIERHDLPAVRLHPLVQLAQENQLTDPATLRELMQLQREWEAGEARKAFAAAMVRLKRDLPAVIAHDSEVDYAGKGGRVHYTHASRAAVVESITEHLTAHGFALTSNWRTLQGGVEVTTILRHQDGHETSTTATAPVDTSGGKNAIQGIASTVSYLERYQAVSLLGLATRGAPEPEHEAVASASPAVDPARNLRAAAEIVRRGRRREDAETHVGRPVSAWTSDDLAALRTWLREPEPAPDGETYDYGPPPLDRNDMPPLAEKGRP